MFYFVSKALDTTEHSMNSTHKSFHHSTQNSLCARNVHRTAGAPHSRWTSKPASSPICTIVLLRRSLIYFDVHCSTGACFMYDVFSTWELVKNYLVHARKTRHKTGEYEHSWMLPELMQEGQATYQKNEKLVFPCNRPAHVLFQS